ncbi:MAG: hypothetical protein MJ016_06035, partial [Victivallaceae bacterium]|nr:hypothetical protein [Victivallaceae bacterium]
DPAWRRDPLDTVDPQIGFVVFYDGARAVDFTAPGFDDSSWQNAVAMKKNPSLAPRPVPVMETTFLAARGIERGLLRRGNGNGAQPFALTMAQDELRVEKGNGFFMIFDLGCERTGRIVLEADCRKSGIVIDIAHGEHLADRRVRSRIGERNFADRYLTRAGVQRFELPRRVGGRYVQLNVIAPEEDFPRLAVSFIEETLPLPETARFVSQDEAANKLRDNCERTLRCCMHEHYEDCPWREQALYGYDTRNQMLFGYYLWGNYDYAVANWRLFPDGMRPDGLLPLNAPSKCGPPIVSFAIAYVSAMADHHLFSGTDEMYRSCRSAAQSILHSCTANFDTAKGLYLTPGGDGVWHFYEWRDGLDGGNEKGLDFSHLGGAPRLESIYNLYLIEMFGALANVSGDASFARKADGLRRAVRDAFYDETRKVLLTRHGDDRLHATTQALALYCGVIPGKDETQLLDRILDGEFIPISLSSLRYLVDALMRRNEEKYARRAEALIREKFLPMTRGDSTTMWETEDGEAAFDRAGSLCHGWSALPLYFFHRYVLGIVPVEPGFARFAVELRRFGACGDVEGEAVTPKGKILVRYDRDGKKLFIAHPRELICDVSETTKKLFGEIELSATER